MQYLAWACLTNLFISGAKTREVVELVGDQKVVLLSENEVFWVCEQEEHREARKDSEEMGSVTGLTMNWKTAIRTFCLLLSIFGPPAAFGASSSLEIPCIEFSAAIKVDCLCSLNQENATRINCDNVVFPGDFPVLPFRYYIQVLITVCLWTLSDTSVRCQEFSQKHVGWQLLPAQIFTASDIPLKHVDFSHNKMRRLAERLFDGGQLIVHYILLVLLFHFLWCNKWERGRKRGKMNLIVGLMTTIMTESVQNWHFYLEAWGGQTTHDTHKNVSGMEDTLEEIFLSHNLLGDNLSPVFSTRFDTKTCFIRFPLTQNSFSSLLCNSAPSPASSRTWSSCACSTSPTTDSPASRRTWSRAARDSRYKKTAGEGLKRKPCEHLCNIADLQTGRRVKSKADIMVCGRSQPLAWGQPKPDTCAGAVNFLGTVSGAAFDLRLASSGSTCLCLRCTEGSAWFCLTSAYCYGAGGDDDDDRRELSELRQELPDGNHVPNLVVAAQLGRIVGYQACLLRQGVRTLQVQKQAEILQLHVEMLLLRRSPRKLQSWLPGHLATAAATFIQYVPQIWCLHNYTCTCSMLSGPQRARGFLRVWLRVCAGEAVSSQTAPGGLRWLEVAAGEKLNLFSVTASGRHLLLRKPFWRNDNTKRWAYSSQVEHKENCKVGRFAVGIVGQSLWGPLPGVIS